MDQIDYRVTKDNGLSFELLVNGNSVGYESGIPYWMFQDDLPTCPSYMVKGVDDDLRIVAVCSCGEPGCGSVQCRVDVGPDSVRWFEFDGDPALKEHSIQFVFPRHEYARVISEIVSKAKAHQAVERDKKAKRRPWASRLGDFLGRIVGLGQRR